MRKFGILGHPLGHSLSPQIHTALFVLDGETVDYQMYDITPEELHDKFDFLSTLDGFNITIPHKVSIMTSATDWTQALSATARSTASKSERTKRSATTPTLSDSQSPSQLSELL